MDDFVPAADLAAKVSRPFPNDSPPYRAARTALLTAEIELRRQIERVAAQRRALPPGGIAPSYRFHDEGGQVVELSDLFGAHDTLVTYQWMYGPERERPCPMCTAFVGSLEIPARDISQNLAICIVGRSPVARQLAFARERGWRNLRFYATIGDEFSRDYRALASDGSEWPALDVWTKQETVVRHFWGEELEGTSDPQQDPRGAPDLAPLWNVLDLTPRGRPVNWRPQLRYPSS